MFTDPRSPEHLKRTPSGRPRGITNPAIGDVLTFVEATDETGGERLGAQRTLRPGDEASVPPRTPHHFFSESDRPVTSRVTVLDPGRLEDGLRIPSTVWAATPRSRVEAFPPIC